MPEQIRLPILTYHSIDSTGSVLSTSPTLLRKQVEFLARAGFRSLTLSEAMSVLNRTLSVSSPCVVLTFDDGFRSIYEHALPLLRDQGFKGTLFVVTEYAGLSNDWPGQSTKVPRLPLMNWEQLHHLSDQGWELAGHSATHPRLTDLNESELEKELLQCQARLAEITGRPVEWFAYPYGSYNRRVREQVQRFFRGACSTELAFATPESDRFAVERIDMFYLRSPIFFEAMRSKWMLLYLKLRQAIRKTRGRC